MATRCRLSLAQGWFSTGCENQGGVVGGKVSGEGDSVGPAASDPVGPFLDTIWLNPEADALSTCRRRHVFLFNVHLAYRPASAEGLRVSEVFSTKWFTSTRCTGRAACVGQRNLDGCSWHRSANRQLFRDFSGGSADRSSGRNGPSLVALGRSICYPGTTCPSLPPVGFGVRPHTNTMPRTATTRCFEIVDFETIEGVSCPCGVARRALASSEHFPGTIHRIEISADARLHCHKRLTL